MTFKPLVFPPDDEKVGNLLAALGDAHYQADRLEAALPYVRQRRRAIDGGAHIGMWTRQLLPLFKCVTAFEPAWREHGCLVKNAPEAEIHRLGLGDRDCVRLFAADGLGAHVAAPGELANESSTLAPLDAFGFRDVDFVKLDLEGYEYYALMGARKTIKVCKPVVVIEQKHSERYKIARFAALELLKSWGYVTMWRKKHDFCLLHPDNCAEPFGDVESVALEVVP